MSVGDDDKVAVAVPKTFVDCKEYWKVPPEPVEVHDILIVML